MNDPTDEHGYTIVLSARNISGTDFEMCVMGLIKTYSLVSHG